MKIIYTDKHKLHNTDQVFVEGNLFITEEIPDRALIILENLKTHNIGDIALPTDHGLEPILAVHDPDFIEHLHTIYTEYSTFYDLPVPVFPATLPTRPVRYKSDNILARVGYYTFGTGSPILAGTWDAAYWSVQCALTGADELLVGKKSAYALCRPPGHHAGTNVYGGFCYLNNAAIAAKYLKQRVAILDIDYHHGNGTQEIFYSDPSVLYCSLHAHPDDDYPYYWGSETELGEGPGYNYNRNLPLPRGINDSDYLNVLDQALFLISQFNPSYLIISLGLDIGTDDPVGGFCITKQGFSEISKAIKQLEIPTLIVQEGGYKLDTLGENAVAFLQGFV